MAKEPSLLLVCPPVPWDPEDYSSGTVMLEAISKLLETTPIKKDVPSRGVGTVPRSGHVNFPPFQIEMGTSREGMCMLSHYCTPTTTIQVFVVGVCLFCLFVVYFPVCLLFIFLSVCFYFSSVICCLFFFSLLLIFLPFVVNFSSICCLFFCLLFICQSVCYYSCTDCFIFQESQQDWLVHLIALVLNWLQDYYDLLHSASLSPDEGQHLSLGGGGTDFIDVGALQDCMLQNYV